MSMYHNNFFIQNLYLPPVPVAILLPLKYTPTSERSIALQQNGSYTHTCEYWIAYGTLLAQHSMQKILCKYMYMHDNSHLYTGNSMGIFSLLQVYTTACCNLVFESKNFSPFAELY